LQARLPSALYHQLSYRLRSSAMLPMTLSKLLHRSGSRLAMIKFAWRVMAFDQALKYQMAWKLIIRRKRPLACCSAFRSVFADLAQV
jgi:hypothetical protein